MKTAFLVCIFLLAAATSDHKIEPLKNRSLKEVNSSSAKETEEPTPYKEACHKLRGMADWMSVALRLKSFLSRSASERKRARLKQPSDGLDDQDLKLLRKAGSRNSTKAGSLDDDSCDSFKNLYTSAQTYVLWQTELMKNKALLGGSAVKTGMAKLNDTPVAIKRISEKLPPSVLQNRTANDFLQSMKTATQAVAISLQEQRIRALNLIRNARKSNDFLRYLGSTKDGMIYRINELVETSENLRKVRDSLKKGELLNFFNGALDRMRNGVQSLTVPRIQNS